MATPPVRILLIDDDPDEGLLVSHLLADAWRPALVQGRGYSVQHVLDVAQGREILAADTFDCALIDQRLGGAFGTHLLFIYRSWGGQRPILLLTYLDDRRSDELALRDGASDFLVKGQFSGDRLFRSIAFALRETDTRRRLVEERDELRRQLEVQRRRAEVRGSELENRLGDLQARCSGGALPAAELAQALSALRALAASPPDPEGD